MDFLIIVLSLFIVVVLVVVQEHKKYASARYKMGHPEVPEVPEPSVSERKL